MDPDVECDGPPACNLCQEWINAAWPRLGHIAGNDCANDKPNASGSVGRQGEETRP
ncbi:MAG: hypothetical protein JWM99_2633 [Verrucomicrobiales bacterium]|nr:hypothetical protein [Verrucomicrobiales bacterium]